MICEDTCYACNSQSTSREHAPPRCIFPEAKDLGGDHRQGLITVPSCDEHNAQKSLDDEFLMVSLAGIIGNNSIGYQHKFTKVNRALKRSSLRLLEKSLKNPRLEWVKLGENKFIDVIWGTPDFDRLDRCFDQIARALFLHTVESKFLGRTRALLGYTKNIDQNAAEFQRMIRDKVHEELRRKPLLGSNQDVFQYQFTDEDEFGLRLAFLRFYGGMDVYVAMLPPSFERARTITSVLIDAGIRTVVRTSTGTYGYNFEPPSASEKPM